MRYFITGIGTGVGKTIVSAIITQALEADYWKPVQAGDLDCTDTETVKGLVSNSYSVFHPEAFRLKKAISPHAAAASENLEITLENLSIPETENTLVIEGAGGVMAPLNSRQTMLDLMQRTDSEIILVSSHYLGSINHTLLSWKVLTAANLKIRGIVFNGPENRDSETFILENTGSCCLLRIQQKKIINKHVVQHYAGLIKESLK